MKTYDIHEAADFLKVDRTTALELAATGELPGAKVGRAWVFLEGDLVEYLRDRVRRQTAERRDMAELRKAKSELPPVADPRPRRGRRRTIPSLSVPDSAEGLHELTRNP